MTLRIPEQLSSKITPKYEPWNGVRAGPSSVLDDSEGSPTSLLRVGCTAVWT
ncbi:hypothetical protein K443DRAFT_683890 [Laccaria amethystina LaAM-08-1]|uniref:Uncharacterized protein n=1 Tax=Laccaria amethystina LaAM-08-1 TaxID=1095629 RepID=A0A0C9WJ94_9AGAR|nr:hypothetical protein K443DRAFT_683890 [Laccaria amethystina LaAM-08-1]